MKPVKGKLKGKLTPRQLEVLTLVAEGFTTGEIATHMGIAYKTVEVHRLEIARRLHIKGVALLTRKAITMGLVRLLELEEK